MKMRTHANKAGKKAASDVQYGLVLKGGINHPRPDHVGRKVEGTLSLGVLIPARISMPVIIVIAIMTAKSLAKKRILEGK